MFQNTLSRLPPKKFIKFLKKMMNFLKKLMAFEKKLMNFETKCYIPSFGN